jgi:elongation factor Ts
MAITASQVKELREMTGAGMMDCKKALTNTDGDMDQAIEWLRENGLAKAANKSGRIAAEGIVAVDVSADGKSASIVEVNSETDFVAKNEKFQAYVAEVAAQVKKTSATTIEEFMAEKWEAEDAGSVDDKLKAMIAVIGENMNIRRFEKVETQGQVVSYIHAGGKIGVLVVADTDSDSDGVKECLKNVAMQVAALRPQYVSGDDVDEDYKEHEKAILLAQAKNDPKNANKPDQIIEKMITGRLNKELKEVCLMEQEYFKSENKESVGKYVESVAKAEGCTLKVTKFIRFETGEGIEKKEEDFAAEVAAQMQ